MGAPKGGPGWGGPAKGAGNGSPGKPFGAGNQMSKRRTEPEVKANRERDLAWADEMKALLHSIAHNGEAEANRLNAAVKLLDRLEGMPVAKQVVAGDPDAPLQTSLTVSFVKASEDSSE